MSTTLLEVCCHNNDCPTSVYNGAGEWDLRGRGRRAGSESREVEKKENGFLHFPFHSLSMQCEDCSLYSLVLIFPACKMGLCDFMGLAPHVPTSPFIFCL